MSKSKRTPGELLVSDWAAIAKLAGHHGVRYRTNAALEAFFADARTVLAGNSRDELVTALKTAVGIIENCDVKAGVCCCGDDMQNHANPMDCGHSPVDQGEYSTHLWLVEAHAALAKAEGR